MSDQTKATQVLTILLEEIQPVRRMDLIAACVRVLGTTTAGARKMIDVHVADGRIIKSWQKKPRSVVYSLPKPAAGANESTPKKRLTSEQLIERTRPSASEPDELRAAIARDILAFMADADQVPNDGAGWSAGAIAAELRQEPMLDASWTRQVSLAIASLVKDGQLHRSIASSGFYAYCLPSQVPPRATPTPAGQAVSVRVDADEQPPQRGPDAPRPVTAQPDSDCVRIEIATRAATGAQVRAGIEGSLRDVDDLLSEVLDAEAPHTVARSVLAAQISLRHALAAMPAA